MKNDRNSRKTAVLQSEKGLSRNHFRLILILIAIIVIALLPMAFCGRTAMPP